MPDLRLANRLIDAALLATWPDGSQVLLVEHWSRIRDIDWPRMALYVCALKVQHPEADVLPVMLVTDKSDADVPELWQMNKRPPPAVTLAVRVVRPRAADVPRYRDMENRVAAALIAVAMRDRVKAAVSAAIAFVRAPGSSEEIKQFLPFLEELANLRKKERIVYLKRMRKEPSMSIIEEWLAEKASEAQAKGKAEGMAEGKAEGMAAGKAEGMAAGKAEGMAAGQVALLSDLVARNVLSIETARVEIERLVAAGALTRAQADAATIG
jgi:hypothetical protein